MCSGRELTGRQLSIFELEICIVCSRKWCRILAVLQHLAVLVVASH
jgi:hypothetical protein